jgi:hypothetical protein
MTRIATIGAAFGFACSSGGDITAIVLPAGSGLRGGGESGEVQLAVAFGKEHTEVPPGDHDHDARYHPRALLDGLLEEAREPTAWPDLRDPPGAASCAGGQVLKRNAGDDGWVCEADAEAGFEEVRQYVTAAAIDLAPGSTIGGQPIGAATSVAWSLVSSKPAGFADNTDNDSLAALSCASGNVPQWDGSKWECASVGAVAWSAVTSKPAGFADNTDNDTLGAMQCAEGQLPKWSVSNGAWICSDDRDLGTLRVGQKSYALGGVYKQATADPYNGLTVGGPTGAKAKCEAATGSAAAHMCTPEEMVRSLQLGVAPPAEPGWIYTGSAAYFVPGGTGKTADDCSGWTASTSSALGMTWVGGGPPTFASPQACNLTFKILCCDTP